MQIFHQFRFYVDTYREVFQILRLPQEEREKKLPYLEDRAEILKKMTLQYLKSFLILFGIIFVGIPLLFYLGYSIVSWIF